MLLCFGLNVFSGAVCCDCFAGLCFVVLASFCLVLAVVFVVVLFFVGVFFVFVFCFCLLSAEYAEGV